MTGTATERRKLIEVALPLKEINEEAAREKSIRHGHPSTLHLWWARRPLAAARAVLFAQLVDDPSAHPERFPDEEAVKAERDRLFEIIKRLVPWEATRDETVLAEARAEIARCWDGTPPPICDPFAGGGTIPLEAQRLGLQAHASDLNPVAVLICMALLDLPQRWAGQPPVHPDLADLRGSGWRGGRGLAEDVKRYGAWIREQAERQLGHLYPKAEVVGLGKRPVIAWLWARTVTCPNPACEATAPLVKQFWLGKKPGKQRYLQPVVKGREVRFDVRGPAGEPRPGTVSAKGAECLVCGGRIPLDHIRAEGKAHQLRQQLMAMVVEGQRQRLYLPADPEHIKAADVPVPDDVPETLLPKQALGFRVQNYGLTRHRDLFTPRQLTTLTTLCDLVTDAHECVLTDARAAGHPDGKPLAEGGTGASAYADAVMVYLALALSKVADNCSNLCAWRPDAGKEGLNHVFARQAVSMVWDFSEGNPFELGPSDLDESAEWIAKAVNLAPAGLGRVTQGSADRDTYSSLLVATDPPYYDNVPYADLSDFFYVWLRRILRPVVPDLFATVLTPKADELVADQYRLGGKEKAREFFESGFERVFAQIRAEHTFDAPITIYYAFKQTETDGVGGEASTGWQTLLSALIHAGWTITATWPMRTELGNRMRNIDSNALASSIVLACRPRRDDALATDRRGLLDELRRRLPGAVRELQEASLAPVDMAQAAIGPGMAVYSSYSRVLEHSGEEMSVRAALVLINQVLGEVLAEQEGDLDTDSRWCLRWFEQYGFGTGPYGKAETLASAVNTSVKGLERSAVLTAHGGRVSLLRPEQLDAGYDPATDRRIGAWEVCLHLIRLLERQGADAAGEFLAAARQRIDIDAVKELAYLLFRMCERAKRTAEAIRFNALVTSWPDIVAAANNPSGQLSMGGV